MSTPLNRTRIRRMRRQSASSGPPDPVTSTGRFAALPPGELPRTQPGLQAPPSRPAGDRTPQIQTVNRPAPAGMQGVRDGWGDRGAAGSIEDPRLLPGSDDAAGDDGGGGTLEDALERLLAGERDTTAEKDLAREMMEHRLGRSLADSAARMGAAGFGRSGADVAIGGDIQRENMMGLLDQLQGIDRSAREEDRQRIATAGGLELGIRGMDVDLEKHTGLMDMLSGLLGWGDDPAPEDLIDEGGEGGGGSIDLITGEMPWSQALYPFGTSGRSRDNTQVYESGPIPQSAHATHDNGQVVTTESGGVTYVHVTMADGSTMWVPQDTWAQYIAQGGDKPPEGTIDPSTGLPVGFEEG